jgi:biopolymer transport protein ExbD
MSHGPSHGGGSAEPNLTPLLDVVLQLLMFFMITVNFSSGEVSEEVKLPEAQSAVPLDPAGENWVFLNVTADGKLTGTLKHLDTLSKLKAFLQEEKKEYDRKARMQGKPEAKVTIILRAHREATYRQVWEVLQTCTDAGIRHWQLRLTKVAPKA